MKTYRLIAVVCMAMCCAVCCANAQDLQKMQAQIKNVVAQAMSCMVAIAGEDGEMGSGVIVEEDGLVLTASHVVSGKSRVTVIFQDGKTYEGKVLGLNLTRDAGMVQIVDGKQKFPCAELGESYSLKVGDYVIAVGHAKGYDPTRTPPVRLGRLCTDGRQRFMISECLLIGGDSGGGLFDLNGKLVAINASIGPKLRLNSHIPIATFRRDWDKLKSGAQWGKNGTQVMEDPDTPVLGCALNQMPGVVGVVVDSIMPKSSAHIAGMQDGDVIVQIDDRIINSTKDMVRELGRYRPGEKAIFVVKRQGEKYQAEVLFERKSEMLNRLKREQE